MNNNGEIKPKNEGSKRLFENSVLEKLSHTHIAIPITLYFLAGLGFGIYAVAYTYLSVFLLFFLFLVGLFVFTFAEYWIHRGLYHMETDTEKKKKFQYTIHGVHHEYPKDKTRQAMPPFISITIILTTLSISRWLIGEYAFGFLSGFFVGYASYLIVHYILHAYPPPNNFFKFLWVNHAIHHYKDGQVVFGVITPLWDYVFGTMPKKSLRSTFKQHNFEQN